MKAITGLIAVLLCGCAGQRELVLEESAWQAVHLVDALQTNQIRAHPGYYEAESAWAIGREPSSRSVATYFAAESVLHLAAARLLYKHPWALRAFEGVTFYDSAQCVIGNYEIGIRF